MNYWRTQESQIRSCNFLTNVDPLKETLSSIHVTYSRIMNTLLTPSRVTRFRSLLKHYASTLLQPLYL